MFVRVRDKETRHEFDLREDHKWLRDGTVEHIKPRQYPPSRLPRPPKHYLNLAGRPATQEQPPAPAEGDVEATENPEE